MVASTRSHHGSKGSAIPPSPLPLPSAPSPSLPSTSPSTSQLPLGWGVRREGADGEGGTLELRNGKLGSRGDVTVCFRKLCATCMPSREAMLICDKGVGGVQRSGVGCSGVGWGAAEWGGCSGVDAFIVGNETGRCEQAQELPPGFLPLTSSLWL